MYLQSNRLIYNAVKEGADIMATTNVTMRMDEDLKKQLQKLEKQ